MRYWFGLCCLLLSACQALPEKGEDAPAYLAVPVGSSLVLNQSLHIPADQVSIYLQYGNVVDRSIIKKYYPSCKFELFTLSELPRVIEADRFLITRVRDDTELVGIGMFRFASADISQHISTALSVTDVSDSPTAEIFFTEFYLRSASQPDVYRLTCEHWDDAYDGEHLTIAQIRMVLGEVFTLQLLADN